MNSDRLLQALSYTAVFCGFLSLWTTGALGIAGGLLFVALVAGAWLLEGTRFQLSERMGTVLILLAIPVFYILWRYRLLLFTGTGSELPAILARLILSLSAIKLLQKKTDRDWIFLFVMAFFQVLLAAGITISATYLVTFGAFVFVMVSTIIVFESRKTEESVRAGLRRGSNSGLENANTWPGFLRLLRPTALLIVAITAVAAPVFFMLPRVGGAGIGGQSGLSTSTGFSDTVRLGGIGTIQMSDEVVMRVRLDEDGVSAAPLRWRGIALDVFDNLSWRQSKAAIREVRERGERDLIQVDYLRGQTGLQLQTVYLEPLDTPVLFALHRAVAVQGNFQILFKDAHDSLSFPRSGERVTYKAVSETALPEPDVLRADRAYYPLEFQNYLQLPRDLDERIFRLAENLTADAANRYEAATRVERYLQNEFGYTLAQRAGGDQPLADFLFNIREGHCEYFATAMAIMLRTQGIATRVVNGFQEGEFNETAGVYVVRQREAHSWVEVYFPGEGVWVPFDPTPFAGMTGGAGSTGIVARMSKYIEALEMFWIQYFVAYDNQEQRSLFTMVRRGFSDLNDRTSSSFRDLQDVLVGWWREVRGDSGARARLVALGTGLGVIAGIAAFAVLLGWSYRRAVRSRFWHWLWLRLYRRHQANAVEFYERMTSILAARGMVREPCQTPMEFAYRVGLPEVVTLTNAYHRVRFGEKQLSGFEVEEIEQSLGRLKVGI